MAARELFDATGRANCPAPTATWCKDHTVELRALLSVPSVPAAWDLRCEVREKLIAFLQEEYPSALPRTRQEFVHRETTHDTELSPHALVSGVAHK